MALPAAARDLPVVDVLPDLGAALEHYGTALLVAPPGAGKTTVAPLWLLEQSWLTGRIVMLEPRRLATRAAAQRMAALLATEIGLPQDEVERDVAEELGSPALVLAAWVLGGVLSLFGALTYTEPATRCGKGTRPRRRRRR